MATLIDLPNNDFLFDGFDPANGMALTWDVYTGSLSFPSRSTGSSVAAWNVATTVASGIHANAIIGAAMGRMTASGYFTTNWFSFGGSGVPVWIDVASGGFSAKYQAWVIINSGNLQIWGRQWISNHSNVGSATLSFRVALLGFATKI